MADAPDRPRRRGRRRRSAVLVTAAVAVLLVAVAGWTLLTPGSDRVADPAPPPSPLVGRPAPQLAGRTLAGGELELADLRGSVVLVTVWASWCAPCREELPVLVDAEHRLGPHGLRLVGIDHRDGEEPARELLADVGGDPADSIADPGGSLADRWQVQGVPQTFVVDADGTVRASRLGAVDRAWIDRTAGPLLPAGGPAAGSG